MKSNLHKFKKSEWRELPILKHPSVNHGQVREYDGNAYEWVSGGKYVYAQISPAWLTLVATGL